MVRYKTDKNDGKTAVLSYFVEGSDDNPGKVAFDISTKTASLIELASEDRHSQYANHLMVALEDHWDGMPDNGTIMWY